MNWYQCYGLIYLLCVYRMPSFRRRIVLPMVFSLSICDSLQLVVHAISGCVVLADLQVDKTINIIIGMTMEGLWCVTLYQHVTLALNRMYVVTRKGLSADTPLSFIDWIPIQLSWIGGLVYALCYVYEGRNTHFDKNLLSWTGTLQWKPFNLLLLYIKFSLLGAGLIACFVVVISMMLKRRDQSTDRRLFKPLEIQLFAQTSTIFVIAIIYTVMWYVIPQGSENLHILALVNLDQIVINALSPYLNLIMSGEIRRSVFGIITCGRNNSSNTMFTKVAPSSTLLKPISP
ncbi:hypothetical protein M3Y96_00261100 [Aphelenchoides besseyi]|nr:hypothetical protein M3Y96_00261100 [Aphelenchoides besseyi]